MTYDIVPTRLAVKAMRDNGYKNPAYAIAELMDNAIQAGATQVELLCGEEKVLRRQRMRSQIKQIAVLDNGSGMDANVLRIALQFGNGMYLEPERHTGMGRFGMGLPSSSISQCKKVEVWTWQDGVDSAIYSYIDLDQVEKGSLTQVPAPEPRKISQVWRDAGSAFAESGTLVVWSKIDRCMWRTASTIIKNSEFLIGRIYRRFLVDERVKIRMACFELDSPLEAKEQENEKCALPNDPLYLMTNTSCPRPDNIPLGESIFELWGEEMVFAIEFQDQVHEVKIRYSYAKEKAREGHNPGARPYGKHAARNVGVSIIRAERELDLDAAWSDPFAATDRWWSVEVEFPPTLDGIFGVTNNKQAARYFSDLAKVDLETLLEEGQTLGAAREILEADEDPRWPLLEIAHHIRTNIILIRKLLKAQTKGAKTGPKRHNTQNTPEAKATQVTQKRKQEGYTGESDGQETFPAEERKAEIEEELVELGVMKKTAEELAASTVSRGYKYTFAHTSVASPSFFDVKPRGGSIIISLNTDHPAYENLVEILEEEVEGVDEDTLKSRLIRAGDGLKLLLSAWARYEDEQPDGPRRTRAQEARWDWGRMAREFLEGEE